MKVFTQSVVPPLKLVAIIDFLTYYWLLTHLWSHLWKWISVATDCRSLPLEIQFTSHMKAFLYPFESCIPSCSKPTDCPSKACLHPLMPQIMSTSTNSSFSFCLNLPGTLNQMCSTEFLPVSTHLVLSSSHAKLISALFSLQLYRRAWSHWQVNWIAQFLLSLLLWRLPWRIMSARWSNQRWVAGLLPPSACIVFLYVQRKLIIVCTFSLKACWLETNSVHSICLQVASIATLKQNILKPCLLSNPLLLHCFPEHDRCNWTSSSWSNAGAHPGSL